jgi:ribosomal protein S18 acetylase RimI-like enzyme
MDPRVWELRQATAEDEDLLYEIHRAAMHDHVGAVWGWDEADQRARFRAAFDPARISVITVAGQSVGLLRVDDRGDEVFLASVELVPEIQRRGVGGEIVRSVLTDAAERNIPVRLQVLRQNPARRLYERLGFRLVGETATHVEMVHD